MTVLFWFFQPPNHCPLLPLPAANLLPEPIVLPWLSLGSTSSLASRYHHHPAHCYRSRSLPSFKVDLPSFRKVLLSWHSWHPGRRVRDSPARRLPGLGPCVVYSVYMVASATWLPAWIASFVLHSRILRLGQLKTQTHTYTHMHTYTSRWPLLEGGWSFIYLFFFERGLQNHCR